MLGSELILLSPNGQVSMSECGIRLKNTYQNHFIFLSQADETECSSDTQLLICASW